MQNIISLFSHPIIKNLDKELSKVFENAPHLPKKVTEILAKIAPYLILISGLFLITGGLRSIFGAHDFYRIFNFWKGIPPFYFYVEGVFQILLGVISVIAYKPLKDRQMDGWYALFCLTALELFMNIFSVIFLRDGFFGLILSLAISLYILYEVKAEYGLVKSVTQKVVKEVAKVKKAVKNKAKKK